MCAKKMTTVAILLVLVLASALAWPSGTVKEEEATQLVVAESAEKKETSSSTQGEDYQKVVSDVREKLSTSKLSKKQAKEVNTILDDAEAGIGAMVTAYNKLAGFHMGIIPSVGYTIGQPVENAFDIGLNIVANYKHWYATIGANKGVDFKNFKSSFTSWDGLRCSLGFGFQIF